MRTSAVFSILLGAGALAQPHLKHAPLHHHHRRDQTKTWDEGNVHYVEDIVDVYVTLAPGQNALPATSSAPLAIHEDWVKGPYNGAATNSPAPAQSAYFPAAEVVTVPPQAVTSTSTPSATPTPVAAAHQVENYVPPQQHQQSSQPAPQAQKPAPSSSSTPQQASSGGTSGGSGDTTYWSTSPKSPLNDPSGTDVLTRANYWRTKWISTLTPFTWSSLLANNSYTTTITPTTYTTDPKTGKPVPHGESDGTIMGHILYPGSFAQCIATGNNVAMNGTYSPFDEAFLMWICEEPNGLEDCDVMGEGGGDPSDTGHAEIIKGGYTEIGCFWMGSDFDGGMWTCDFAGGAGT